LRPIIEQEAVAWAIGIVTPEEIDRINILNASFLAMHRAIEQLNPQPQHLLIDGNRFKPYPDIQPRLLNGGNPFKPIPRHSPYLRRKRRR